jgi:hypothetical protein
VGDRVTATGGNWGMMIGIAAVIVVIVVVIVAVG